MTEPVHVKVCEPDEKQSNLDLSGVWASGDTWHKVTSAQIPGAKGVSFTFAAGQMTIPGTGRGAPVKARPWGRLSFRVFYTKRPESYIEFDAQEQGTVWFPGDSVLVYARLEDPINVRAPSESDPPQPRLGSQLNLGYQIDRADIAPQQIVRRSYAFEGAPGARAGGILIPVPRGAYAVNGVASSYVDSRPYFPQAYGIPYLADTLGSSIEQIQGFTDLVNATGPVLPVPLVSAVRWIVLEEGDIPWQGRPPSFSLIFDIQP